MRPRSELVTSSRFERRIPPGRFDLLFRVTFGGDAMAARSLRVSRTQIWRWRHRSHLPNWVADILTDLVQRKVEEAHLAQTELRYFLQEPPKPPRPLSGCCSAEYVRKPK